MIDLNQFTQNIAACIADYYNSNHDKASDFKKTQNVFFNQPLDKQLTELFKFADACERQGRKPHLLYLAAEYSYFSTFILKDKPSQDEIKKMTLRVRDFLVNVCLLAYKTEELSLSVTDPRTSKSNDYLLSGLCKQKGILAYLGSLGALGGRVEALIIEKAFNKPEQLAKVTQAIKYQNNCPEKNAALEALVSLCESKAIPLVNPKAVAQEEPTAPTEEPLESQLDKLTRELAQAKKKIAILEARKRPFYPAQLGLFNPELVPLNRGSNPEATHKATEGQRSRK